MTTATLTTLSDPATFKERWVDGMCAAYARTVRRAPDAFGVLSNAAPRPGKVAVIVGGGCGHYPAFAGLVGPGLADAAVVGDVFTSPSAEQAYRTAKAVDGGAGVVFSYGNYAGDVMHFGLAGRRLAAEGIEARQMIVTDDVASAPAERAADRRGVAGDFFVFKVLGAAAERGDDLDGVMAAGERANEVTRTFGAAFDGCTLPGQSDPLFTVEPGSIELGLGIHGEPGMRTAAAMDAYELADALVDQLLPQVPQVGDGRVAVLLNGLGSTTYEDLFVTYGRVHARLCEAGLTPHRPEVGEFVTSMDMAGLSLSLMPLDDELAALYDAPCETPGFRLPAGGTLASGASEALSACSPELLASGGRKATSSIPDLEDTDPDAGGIAAAALTAALAAVTEHEDELGRLDAVAADGDHGQGIVRGMRAAVAAARTAGGTTDTAHDVGTALLAAGTALADAAGGASGALFGVLLTETGARLQAHGDTAVTTAALADAVTSAQAAVTDLGGARPGDKTMVDALDAFTSALRDHPDDDVPTAWQRAADAATAAADRTADLTPAVGRAARLGDRGRGSADPGATSFALMATAAGHEIATRCGGTR